MRLSAILLNWLIAFLWTWRSTIARRNLPRIPDLLKENSAIEPAASPQITVIVPARNEEQAIEQTLRSLLTQEGISIEILAVNDRSTDRTGEIMDRVATEARAEGKIISTTHIDELPAGWMGKTHAMALAARQATAPWLLFTDGDILFRKDCLRRAFSYAEREADHLVLFPTLILKSAGERMMISAFQVLSFIATSPWKVANSKSRESIGIGGFNMIRSDVYRSIGGFEDFPLEVLEDVKLGYQVKKHGFRQRFVFGNDLICVHWAAGLKGIVRNLTKNTFAIFRFRPLVLLGVALAVALFCLVPFGGIFGPWTTLTAGILALGSALELYRYCERGINGISPGYLFLLPVAACIIVYMLLRSMVVTLAQGGVIWRGTFYPLSELRKNAGPLR
jgi:glycosyltransferase involved in cell wall biosynthesis